MLNISGELLYLCLLTSGKKGGEEASDNDLDGWKREEKDASVLLTQNG